jgi:hypothetical protein
MLFHRCLIHPTHSDTSGQASRRSVHELEGELAQVQSELARLAADDTMELDPDGTKHFALKKKQVELKKAIEHAKVTASTIASFPFSKLASTHTTSIAKQLLSGEERSWHYLHASKCESPTLAPEAEKLLQEALTVAEANALEHRNEIERRLDPRPDNIMDTLNLRVRFQCSVTFFCFVLTDAFFENI